MYQASPIHRDKELMVAAALTVVFTLVAVIISAVSFHLSGSLMISMFAAMGMAPVIRAYGSETASEFRGYRRRVEMAAQARARRDHRVAV